MVLKLVALEEGDGIEGIGEQLGWLGLLQRLWRSREGTHGVPVECGELGSEGGPRRADNHARRVVDDDARVGRAGSAAGSGTLAIWR